MVVQPGIILGVWRQLLVCLVLVLPAVTACSNAPNPRVETTSAVDDSRWIGTLVPYVTSTPSQTLIPPTAIVTPFFTSTPSPTPFIHAIQEGETMLGIAIQYGLSLEELQSANPDADPRLLSIGQELVIPILENSPEQVVSELDPVDLRLSSPRCFPGGVGEMNCIVEVLNEEDFAVENILVWFGMFDNDANLIEGKTAISTLNLLGAGMKTALSVSFEPQIPEETVISVDLVSALEANQIQERFASYEIIEQQVTVAPNEKQARITGALLVIEPVRSVWISALAYDEDGQIIGVRKWKGQPVCATDELEGVESTEEPTSTPEPCSPIDFAMTVFSLGPNIAQVDIIAEAAK